MPLHQKGTIRSHLYAAANECIRNNEIPEIDPDKFTKTKVVRAKVLIVLGLLKAYIDSDKIIESEAQSRFLTTKLNYAFREAVLKFKNRESIIESKDFSLFQMPQANSNVIDLDQYRAS